VPWYPVVAESGHDIQNPTTAAKIRLLGERLRLGPESRVLDIACGRGGPALVLALAFGCRIVGVERSPEFANVARERVSDAGLEDLVEIVEGDAREYGPEPQAWDVALCLGATFVWDGLDGTLAALMPAVRPGGYVVVGEPYWRSWPLPAEIDSLGYVSLHETVQSFEASRLSLSRSSRLRRTTGTGTSPRIGRQSRSGSLSTPTSRAPQNYATRTKSTSGGTSKSVESLSAGRFSPAGSARRPRPDAPRAAPGRIRIRAAAA
jgi:SAM-dependent methyltransferase